jgi:hypothetical protein
LVLQLSTTDVGFVVALNTYEPATFEKTTFILGLCTYLHFLIRDQDLSHETEIPVAMTNEYFKYMYVHMYIILNYTDIVLHHTKILRTRLTSFYDRTL